MIQRNDIIYMNQDEYNKILNDYVDLILEVMLMDLMIALGVEQETNQIKLPDYEELRLKEEDIKNLLLKKIHKGHNQ